MTSHFELEQRVRQHLAGEREKEGRRRTGLLSQIASLRGASQFPGDYSNQFIGEVQTTPLDWQIDIFEEGVRFKRDFPYERSFYNMKGWDAARVVVNLDAGKAAVAFRIHLLDGQADINVDEGVLVENGKTTSFDQEIGAGFMYRDIFTQVLRTQESTQGESGCLIDHLKPELDELPSLVRQLSADSYGRFLSSFLRSVKNGEVDLGTMQHLALGWPLLSPYHGAPER